MKMTKRLLAVVLAGVLALGVLTGCGDSSAFGKDMYDAFLKIHPQAAGQTQHSEKIDRRAEAVLKAIDNEVKKEDSGVTWENAIHRTNGTLMSGGGFVGRDNPIEKAFFSGNKPSGGYAVQIGLTEVTVDDPEAIICMIVDRKNENVGLVMVGDGGINAKKTQMGAAKYKASNGKTYAVFISMAAE